METTHNLKRRDSREEQKKLCLNNPIKNNTNNFPTSKKSIHNKPIKSALLTPHMHFTLSHSSLFFFTRTFSSLAVWGSPTLNPFILKELWKFLLELEIWNDCQLCRTQSHCCFNKYFVFSQRLADRARFGRQVPSGSPREGDVDGSPSVQDGSYLDRVLEELTLNLFPVPHSTG